MAQRLAFLLCCALLWPGTPATARTAEEAADERLQQAALAALGAREGAILVLDPRTGRLRAAANSRIAFEQAYPPGSAIKPFTALAGLRAGLLERESKRLCATRYAKDGFAITCSHPISKAPFNLPQALAYSCNDYFAHLAERLSEGAFNGLLGAFGFGARTGASASEATGSLARGDWRPEVALGESPRFLATPVQLLAAYAALVNGGHLYRPQWASDRAFVPREAAKLSIAAAHREILLDGMRGAVRYGTAQRARLDELPGYVFGKTGTSTASNGFRRQGWFVGFLADKPPVGAPRPEAVTLGVLVFLKRSSGAECAAMARAVFEAALSRDRAAALQPASWTPQAGDAVRVRLVGEKRTLELPLEEYLVGVLAAEASIESEKEALKAQAVVSRSFALKNRGRHQAEGFDFCSTTHCQRFVVPDRRTDPRPRAPAREAVEETAGRVLRDGASRVIDAYFHAACGGVTANLETLWGVPAPSYLTGVRDEFCAAMPHRHWQQAIPIEQLEKALQSDPRTDVGPRLRSIAVARRDATGRAELLSLEGDSRRRTVRGWDFKIIVGRSLGWQLLKSSRFDVARAGNAFVFRGSGFGHGLGLCQEGAHVMARRGMTYRQILAFYFPGTAAQ